MKHTRITKGPGGKKQTHSVSLIWKPTARIPSILILILVMASCAAFLFLPFPRNSVSAAQITLAWDSQEGAAGYKIYYGTKSDVYTISVDVGNVTTYPLTLADGHTYYLAATAYDSARLESDFSGEIEYEAGQTHYNLAVQKSGSGSGRVSSTPAAIDCGSSCNAGYEKGARVTLVPTPDSGSFFTGWAGACTGAGTCTVAMDADKSVVATFDAGSSCAYSISSHSRTFSYKGGAIALNVVPKDRNCAAPEIINNTGWVSHTISSAGNGRSTIKLLIPEYDSSLARSGTLTIGGNTFAVAQKGKPCTVKLSASSSPLLPKSGGSGSFDVTVAPTDCEWSAEAAGSSAWIHTTPEAGKVEYTVDENTRLSTRFGWIAVSYAHGRKLFVVRQGSEQASRTER